MSDQPAVDRREALKRVGAAGLAAAAVAGGAVWLGRRPGWPRPEERVVVPTFAVERDGPVLAIARGMGPTGNTMAALEELGGIASFVTKGDRVLVKPNAAFDRPAWQGTTTNPEVVGAVVAACIGAGADEVVVTDNPIHAPEGCFRKTGIGHAAEEAGGRVLLPRPAAFAPVSLPGTLLDGWSVMSAPLVRATKVIGIAPAKDHNLARASITMKNWYGLLGGPRNRLHQKMDETIATLSRLVTPTLLVLDGTRVLVRNGPTGGSPDDVVDGDLVAVATDGVALDSFGATLLGLAPGDLPYLGMAAGHGVGTHDWRSLEPREVSR